MEDVKTFAFTTCCYDILLLNAPAFSYADVDKYNPTQMDKYIFKYALSYPPSQDVMVTPVIRNASTNVPIDPKFLKIVTSGGT